MVLPCNSRWFLRLNSHGFVHLNVFCSDVVAAVYADLENLFQQLTVNGVRGIQHRFHTENFLSPQLRLTPHLCSS